MKIVFPLIKAGSGSDIFTQNLVSGLENESVHADIQHIPRWSGYAPITSRLLISFHEYDVIHANTWNGYAFYGKKPLLMTSHHIVHDPSFTPYKSLSQRLYHKKIYLNEKWSLSVADSVVSISKSVQHAIERVFGYSDSKLIYNGVDTSRFCPDSRNIPELMMKYGISAKKTILFFAGNPTRRKGGDLLPRIMNTLGDDYILLMTDGLRNEKGTHSGNIIPVGKVDLATLVSLYNLADIFLFPSRLEGFGLSVAEAMSCGRPVVTTDCSSLPELVIDGKGGYLCPMDDVSAFTEAIRHLSEDENLRKQMGSFNRKRVLDMFTLEKMTREYIRVYHSLL